METHPESTTQHLDELSNAINIRRGDLDRVRQFAVQGQYNAKGPNATKGASKMQAYREGREELSRLNQTVSLFADWFSPVTLGLRWLLVLFPVSAPYISPVASCRAYHLSPCGAGTLQNTPVSTNVSSSVLYAVGCLCSIYPPEAAQPKATTYSCVVRDTNIHTTVLLLH